MNAPARDNRGSLSLRLRRLPRRYLLLALLVPVLVVLWLPLLTGKSRKDRRPPSPQEAASTTPPAAPAGETAPARTGASVADAAAALDGRLQRLLTPFVPRMAPHDGNPFRAQVIAPAIAEAKEDAELTPTTILLSANARPIAIIGGQPYCPGDAIGSRRIVAIEERRVLFREGNKTYAVSLPEPTLRGDHD